MSGWQSCRATSCPPTAIDVDYGQGLIPADDPYRFLPTLGELDLHLIGEGRHEELWKTLGAHVRTYDSPFGPITGTSFAVWAPNAEGVRVVGDFNGWDGTGHPMRSMGSTGIWELFIPNVGRRDHLQVLDPGQGLGVAGEGRPDGLRAPRCRRPPARSSTRRPTSGATSTGSRPARRPT